MSKHRVDPLPDHALDAASARFQAEQKRQQLEEELTKHGMDIMLAGPPMLGITAKPYLKPTLRRRKLKPHRMKARERKVKERK